MMVERVRTALDPRSVSAVGGSPLATGPCRRLGDDSAGVTAGTIEAGQSPLTVVVHYSSDHFHRQKCGPAPQVLGNGSPPGQGPCARQPRPFAFVHGSVRSDNRQDGLCALVVQGWISDSRVSRT